MKKIILVWVCVGFQVLILTWMAAQREYVLLTGRTVYLRTAPVDPRDIFRGDYVVLNYEISRIPRGKVKGDWDKIRRGDKIYVVLKQHPDGLAELDYATTRKPKSGLFIRGRVRYKWRGGEIRVRYSIEAYFVEQDKGLELERGRRREGVRIPLEMEVALGRNGLAVLKGRRRSK